MGSILRPTCVLLLAMGLAAMAGWTSSTALGHSKNAKADAGYGVESLDIYADESCLHLLVGVKGNGSSKQSVSLEYLRSDDGGMHWSEPVRVTTGGSAVYARRGMDPQISASGERVVAVWTTRIDGQFGRGPLATALSDDRGRTWHIGPNPADDRSDGDHGMMDLAADASRVFHLAWLDARNGQKGLIYARSSDFGRTWSKNQTLNAATCQCCSNTVTVGPDGQVAVLYRQLDPRDMGLVVSPDGGHTWSQSVAVGDFKWEIKGCPHCGGGLAFSRVKGECQCHAVVWTGASSNGGGVFVLSSMDVGKHWGSPRRLGDETACRPQISAGINGEAAVVWDAVDDGHTRIYVARTHDNGLTWSKPQVLSDAGADATHGRIVCSSRGFVVFWTQRQGDHPSVWRSKIIP